MMQSDSGGDADVREGKRFRCFGGRRDTRQKTTLVYDTFGTLLRTLEYLCIVQPSASETPQRLRNSHLLLRRLTSKG